MKFDWPKASEPFALGMLMVICFCDGRATADIKVLAVTVPAHVAWCATSKLQKDAFDAPIGQSAVLTKGSAPILNAAFKAGAKRIGHVYISSFEPSDAEISLTFCAAVPASLQTDDVAITVTKMAATEFLAEVCSDADQCTVDISQVLRGDPYKLTDDQIDNVAWRYGNSPSADNTADAVIAGLNETDSTPVSTGDEPSQSQDAPTFTIVAAPKPGK
jgi:hypothetical protein